MLLHMAKNGIIVIPTVPKWGNNNNSMKNLNPKFWLARWPPIKKTIFPVYIVYMEISFNISMLDKWK